MKKPREDKSRSAPERLQNPFASLKTLREALPEAPSASSAPSSSGKSAPKGPARAVVRYERKGRGGKEATVIEGLDLVPNALDEWLSALKVALGCGGTVENGKLVLQGDQRTRLGVLLANRGVRRVVIG